MILKDFERLNHYDGDAKAGRRGLDQTLLLEVRGKLADSPLGADLSGS